MPPITRISAAVESHIVCAFMISVGVAEAVDMEAFSIYVERSKFSVVVGS